MQPHNFANLEALNSAYILKNAEYEAIQKTIDADEASLNEHKKEAEILEKSGTLLDLMANNQRKEACKKLEDVCTYALQYATGRNLKMKIDMTMLRNKVAAEISVLKPDTGVENFPMDGGGGGLADIISMALRFTLLSTYSSPVIDGPVIFDEPAKNVSLDYIANVADFLMRAAKDFDRQIILSTHNDYIAAAAPKRYRFSLDENDITKIEVEAQEEEGQNNEQSNEDS